MAKFIFRIITNVIVFVCLAYLFPSMLFVSSLKVGIIAGFFLALVNTFLKPLIYFFSIPITCLTMGIFLAFINGFLLELTVNLVDSFLHGQYITINGFTSAVILSIIFSIVNMFVQNYLDQERYN